MADSTKHVLDTLTLAVSVQEVARHRGITMKTVAEETGLSPSTLTRLAQGQKPDADGLVSLLAWLGIPAASTFALERGSTLG